MLKNKIPEEKLDTLLSKCQITIIDLAHCGTEECPIKSVVNRVGSQLQKSLSEKGMALLVNHGISEDKLKMGYNHLDDFCKLDDVTKELYLRKGSNNHGYIKPGQEKFDRKTGDLRHTFNICTLKPDAVDCPLPEEPLPGFRAHISDLAQDFKRLSALLLQALAVGLELPSTYFLEKHTHMLDGENENETTFRLIYYPPLIEDDQDKCELTKGSCKYSYQRCAMDRPDLGIPADEINKYKRMIKKERNGGKSPDDDDDDEEDEKEKAKEAAEQPKIVRCGAHCDYGTFTLLAQDSEGGLEVKLPGTEKWQRVGYLPGAILINTGELLSVWTQEKYPALPHRVIVPPESTARTRGRHSIAFFVHPDNLTPIAPIEVLGAGSSSDLEAKKKEPRRRSLKTAKNKIFNAYQHVQRRFKETYAS